jgi:hypothetical protein
MSLSDAGSYASIASLVLTIVVFLGVRKLRAMYLRTARLPALRGRLRSHASKLASCLNNFAAFHDSATEELFAADATLHSLKRRLDGDARRVVIATLKRLKPITKGGASRVTEQGVRELYVELVRVGEFLKNTELDLTWER